MHIFKYLNQFLVVTYGSLLPIAWVKLLALYTKSEHWKKITLLRNHSFSTYIPVTHHLNIVDTRTPFPFVFSVLLYTVIGSEVNRICCVNFAYSWAKQFMGLLITFFSNGLYSISSIIKLGYNISHLHYDWDNIRMQPWMHKFIILLGLETFFKY